MASADLAAAVVETEVAITPPALTFNFEFRCVNLNCHHDSTFRGLWEAVFSGTRVFGWLTARKDQ